MAQKNGLKNDIEIKLEECEKLRDEYLAGWQRCKADFLNYKKDEVERAQSNRWACQRNWLLRILELYDDLERAEKHLPNDLQENEWVKAVLQIQRQFLQSIEGLEEIKAEGEKFDPNFHEALEQVEDRDKEPGIIIEVLQKGYLSNGDVLRPAKVKVTK